MISLNTGDTAFIILCTALVCLMTPGLALFYGGLVRERNIVSIMLQNFICMGIVAVIWIFGGFSLAFGPDWNGFIGDFSTYFGMIHIGSVPNKEYASSIPFILFFAYQMMFAIITPALMTGAFVGRIRFNAYLKFITLWTIIVYIPVAHWIWGGGFMAKMGVVDFAGGIVVHATAGFSALAAALFVGKRKKRAGETESAPANLPLVGVGAGLLWFGWFGFNAGGAYAANQLAAYAFTNTTISGSVAMLVWLFWSWKTESTLTLSGALVGAVVGLATITPAAGYVEPWAAVVIGCIGATVCFFAKRIQAYFKIDDALEVWRAHGMGGVTGSLLIGIFASGTVDHVHAGIHQFLIQVVAVVFVAVYSWALTWGIMKYLDRNGGLRTDEQAELLGLDKSEHGEEAYHFDK